MDKYPLLREGLNTSDVLNDLDESTNYVSLPTSESIQLDTLPKEQVEGDVLHAPTAFSSEILEEEDDNNDANSIDSDTGFTWSFRRLFFFVGPGLLMSIAYLDPGNIESCLSAGYVAGYKLGWVLLWAHVIGFLFQRLSIRLGTVTRKHLAENARDELPRPLSIFIWLWMELAIICADIQEIIGTAIALYLLFGLTLWIGVLITAVDTFAFLLLHNWGVRKLEAFFAVLISTMVFCFWFELFSNPPSDPLAVVLGVLVPSVPESATLQAVAMLGAVVMPHSIFLHSALVLSRDVSPKKPRELREANFYFSVESAGALVVSFLINIAIMTVFATAYYYSSSTSFESSSGLVRTPGLMEAAFVLEKLLGNAARYVWAVGLLAAGQASVMTGTFAGQFIMEGFWLWKIKPWQRVVMTRSVALLPALLVAILAEEHFDQMNEWLNVVQSVILPFAIIPVLKFTNSSKLMTNSFANGLVTRIICWTIGFLILCINVYLVGIVITSAIEDTTLQIFLLIISSIIYFPVLFYLILVPVGQKHLWIDLPRVVKESWAPFERAIVPWKATRRWLV